VEAHPLAHAWGEASTATQTVEHFWCIDGESETA
jgi:hypothetical protein